jgi:hypothetical protein
MCRSTKIRKTTVNKWLVILQIDNKPRIVEAEHLSEVYEAACRSYMAENDPGPRPEGVKWFEWPMVWRPTCGWSRRRLRDDEPLDPMPEMFEKDDR